MTHRLPPATMTALIQDAAAGNTAAAQAVVAEFRAQGQFAHLDTPEARASLAAWQARHTQQDNVPFATAEDAAAFVQAAMAGTSAR